MIHGASSLNKEQAVEVLTQAKKQKLDGTAVDGCDNIIAIDIL